MTDFWCPTEQVFVDTMFHRHPLHGGSTTVQCPTAGDIIVDGLPRRIEHLDPEMGRMTFGALEAILRRYQEDFPEREQRPDWRRRTLFHFNRCLHTVGTIHRVENDFGAWDIEICNRCGHVERHCPHEKSEWFLDGKYLICLNCGSDGT